MKSIIDYLDLTHTIASSLFEGKKYAWEVLPDIGDFILEIGPTLSEDEYYSPCENVWIAKTATIYESAYISGPAIIGPETEVRHCAFLRGKTLVGAGCVVGNSTELKNVILFDKVQVPHYNYIGDSILGYKAHFGAGAITSNVKSDKENIVVKTCTGELIETVMKKFGAIVGDNVEVGCGTILNPASVVGRNTRIYPLSMIRGEIPENSIYKNSGEITSIQ